MKRGCAGKGTALCPFGVVTAFRLFSYGWNFFFFALRHGDARASKVLTVRERLAREDEELYVFVNGVY